MELLPVLPAGGALSRDGGDLGAGLELGVLAGSHLPGPADPGRAGPGLLQGLEAWMLFYQFL